MLNKSQGSPTETIALFTREFLESKEAATRIGGGAIGRKASGLVFIKEIVESWFAAGDFEGISVDIPKFCVIATDFFDRFMKRNGLNDVDFTAMADDRIAHAFQQAELPSELVGDLWAVVASTHTPLAIRSSSLLEDALDEPFAGVYGTKMIPNNEHSAERRFRKLTEAIKYVYASTYFRAARDYMTMTKHSAEKEKMAVIIQEVIGERHDDRFAPHLSGVARSQSYYPIGRAKPEDGVVDLALGLGKTIVDGGLAWTYSPAYPRVDPPFESAAQLLDRTQTDFWAINMGKSPEHDPIRETEYLVKGDLADAERQGYLHLLASTYRSQDDRVVMGTGSQGPRVLNFAPILKGEGIPLNRLIKTLLTLSEEAVGRAVEIEFAMTFDRRNGVPARFGFLQVRPMAVAREAVAVEEDEMAGDRVLAASDRALGNGKIESIKDVVYVRPEVFEAGKTRTIAQQLSEINRRLIAEERPYLLIGFGRWGSSDPWLGIPVDWSQISGAKVIVEATLPAMDVELSQGSHFFHNMSSFHVCYLSVHHAGKNRIDWEWLRRQNEMEKTDLVRHVRLTEPLSIRVDGRSGRGVISR